MPVEFLSLDEQRRYGRYTSIAIVLDEEGNDPSHSLVKGYEAYNKQVAEELQKVIIDSYPARL